MAGEHREAEGSQIPQDGVTAPERPRRRWIWAVAYLAIVLVVAITEFQDIIEAIRDFDLAAGDAIGSVSITALSEAFVDRFEHCEYRYLVICTPRPYQVDHVLQSGGIVMAVWNGAKILPRLPDAIWNVLKTRLLAGDIGGFIFMLIFIALNVLVWIGVLGDQSWGNPVKRLLVFLVSITLAPLLISTAFGILQAALVLMTSLVGLALQALLLAAAIPGAVVLGKLHLGLSVGEAFKKVATKD